MKKIKDLKKLHLLIITIPKGKKEVIADHLEKYDCIGYLATYARGTSSTKMDKELMFCIIKEDQVKSAILKIEDLMKKFYSNISMVYSIPLSEVIGISSYLILSNGGK